MGSPLHTHETPTAYRALTWETHCAGPRAKAEEVRALDWIRDPISPLSASSSLLLEPRARRAESTGCTRGPQATCTEGVRATVQNPVVATRSRLVKLRGGCQRATSWGAAGEAQVPGPRSQVPSPETNTQRVVWNSAVSKQGCRQGALASHRLGGQEIQAGACGGYKSPGRSGFRSQVAPCLLSGFA